MEESQEILLSSLENSGVSIPNNVSSIRDLTPTTLVSICGQSLNLIENTASFPTSLPDSMSEKFKICTDMASAIKNLGYIGDTSYYKFLYPSEEDLYKLVRFLVESLSELSEGVKFAEIKDVNAIRKIKEDDFNSNSGDWTEKADNGVGINHWKVGANFKDLRLNSEVLEWSNSKAEYASVGTSYHPLSTKMDEMAIDDVSNSRTRGFSKDGLTSEVCGKDFTNEVGELGRGAFVDEETVAQRDDRHVSAFEQNVISLKEQTSKIKYETEKLRNQENVIMEEATAMTSELWHLKEEFKNLEAAAEMAFDDQHPIDFYLKQLNEQVDARKHNLVELESQWNALSKSLEEKKRSLEESLYANIPEAQEKQQKLREVELEMQSVLSEIRRREEEHIRLSSDLEKQPKVASRRSYIRRIQENSKNSRKQDTDIERILKETRELQLESNSIQERLHRTYAVIDEMVFREAKKDLVGRQAYRLLTSIHESFEQISEKILSTDRIRREVAELEKKLAAMASRSLNVGKLQADLDAIMKENKYLEQGIRDD